MDRIAEAIQAANRAGAALRANPGDDEQRSRLAADVRRGASARDELVSRCERMVRFRAARELERRKAWSSSVPIADLVQDGIVGLLKGANSYRPGRCAHAPLTYLATWVVQEMRRRADKADNDWDVSTEMTEKFRRIRAIRSRLRGALGRPPTTAEILDAASDPLYTSVGPFAARHRRANPQRVASHSSLRRWQKLTENDIELEARLRGRLGAVRRLDARTEDNDCDAEDVARPIDRAIEAPDDITRLDEQAAAAGLRKVIECCLAELDPPHLIRTILDQVHGLHGHPKLSQRDLSCALGISRTVVAEATAWFAEAMAQPGGVFFQSVIALDPIDRESLGLSWVERELAGQATQPPTIPRAFSPGGLLATTMRHAS